MKNRLNLFNVNLKTTALNSHDLLTFIFGSMKLILLFLGMIAYANCTLGLLAGLFGGFGGGQAPAPAPGPIIITSNHDDDDGGSSGPIFMPIPIPFPGYGYGFGGGYGGSCAHCK
jgi:hypothetical protein